MTSPPRVLVCGTSFGRVYLRAVHDDPTVELAGVLSRGSQASHRYADAYGVPCYRAPDELPDDIDIACVVVRAGVAGGSGAELSQRLMARGIHVVQEHLLHPKELSDCLRVARRHEVRFRVNSFYPHVAAVRRFLLAAQAMRRRQPPLFVDAMAGVQVLYPLLDVIGRAVGGLRPWRFADPVPPPPALDELARVPSPYTHLHGVVGGTPVSLRVQNHIHPADPDNHALLLHRLSLVFESGVLTLADTHGPVLWSPRMHSERDGTGRLIMAGPGTERLQVPGTEPVGEGTGPTFREVFDRVWPDAVRVALGELRADIADEHRSARAGQWALTVAGMWQDLTGRLGEPRFIHLGSPERVDLPELVAAEAVLEEDPSTSGAASRTGAAPRAVLR
ncbi:Gfo/Idh/MocA family oxidoreductase [Lentzea sp. DG1S-22]|uniref:Gfo/Idh/MocA family oxidoreductase n=1 Tax=Lentzea sp. DG1S-22 TaxID=3108822 RepID=UPI002E7916A4|nr:Gfo/Idh/MocA family oxidoreductase [Lentzea sp. DG1S-22]WVH82207.1 Gfo/Idh/MocA family oxidoreductase [Lentzea sp. DG1S-22]